MKFSFGSALWVIIFFPIVVIGTLAFAAWPIGILLELYQMIVMRDFGHCEFLGITLLMIVGGTIGYVLDDLL